MRLLSQVNYVNLIMLRIVQRRFIFCLRLEAQQKGMVVYMKVAIVSMQEVINYGSFLQAYALKQLLGENNDISYISAYSNTAKVKNKSILNTISKIRIKDLKYNFARQKLKHKIIPMQQRYFKYGDGPYDLTIIGSDEVFNFVQAASWNPSIFWGEGIETNKICSFAASSGNTTNKEQLDSTMIPLLIEGLNKFSEISIRDTGTAELLDSLGIFDYQYLLDPVLLYDFKNEIKTHTYKKESKYIVIYSYNYRFSNENEIKKIKQYAKSNHCKIYAVEGLQKWTDRYLAVNPFELFELFRNAEAVFTDTFHGTIIAAKMHCKFAVFIRESNQNKLWDLVNRVHLEKHLYDVKKHSLEEILTIDDFVDFENEISKQRELAKNYLRTITR